jgi:hypothetical protein
MRKLLHQRRICFGLRRSRSSPPRTIRGDYRPVSAPLCAAGGSFRRRRVGWWASTAGPRAKARRFQDTLEGRRGRACPLARDLLHPGVKDLGFLAFERHIMDVPDHRLSVVRHRAWWKLTQPLKPFDLRVADDRQKQRPFPWPSPASRLQFWKKMALTRLPLVFAAKRVWQRTWHSASFRAGRASSIPRHAGRAKAPTSALGAVGSG